MSRFSKATLLEFLEIKTRRLRLDHGFSSHTGWSQVNGRGEEINRAYGEFIALRDLKIRIEEGYITPDHVARMVRHAAIPQREGDRPASPNDEEVA